MILWTLIWLVKLLTWFEHHCSSRTKKWASKKPVSDRVNSSPFLFLSAYFFAFFEEQIAFFSVGVIFQLKTCFLLCVEFTSPFLWAQAVFLVKALSLKNSKITFEWELLFFWEEVTFFERKPIFLWNKQLQSESY